MTASLTVAFTDPQARVLETRTVTVTMGPKASSGWTVQTATGLPGTRCVIRAVAEAPPAS